jgi:hypothetical protein
MSYPSRIARTVMLAAVAAGMVNTAIAATQPTYIVKVFATGTANAVTNPMSLAFDGTDIWVSYVNSATFSGSSGSSTIIEYSTAGAVLNTYTVPGYVEGLRYDSTTGVIWAVQNPGGNSTITTIKPGSGIVTGSPVSFAVESTTRGYANVDFSGTGTYLTYTQPVNPTDPTIQKITGAPAPLVVKPILLMNATGTNIATGATDQPTLQKDPRALRGTPTKGQIVMSSATQGQLIFVANVGTPTQAVSFLNVVNAIGANVSELNDVIYNDKTSGTFFVADLGGNQIVAITATGLTANSLYGTIGSLSAFAEIDPTDGSVLPIVTDLIKPTSILFLGN